MSDACIFCRIVDGTIPATRLYEDGEVLAFLDIGPIVKGHALVIPKKHLDPLTEVPADLLGRVMEVVQRVARAQVEGLKADGVNLHQCNGRAAGQEVEHVHFHVIPRFLDDGHHWNWHAGSYDSDEEMRETAGRLCAAL